MSNKFQCRVCDSILVSADAVDAITSEPCPSCGGSDWTKIVELAGKSSGMSDVRGSAGSQD